jgi:hypothetical protein
VEFDGSDLHFWPKTGDENSLAYVRCARGVSDLLGNGQKSKQYRPSRYSVWPTKQSKPTWKVPFGVLLAFIAILARGRWGNRAWVDLLTFFSALFAGALILLGYEEGAPKDQSHSDEVLPSSQLLEHVENVSQKHLTYLVYM